MGHWFPGHAGITTQWHSQPHIYEQGDDMQGGLMRRLEGKRAIVTGAGAGIGRAIARRFVEEGARVIVADIDAHAAEGVVAELGDSTVSHQVDVTAGDQMEALIRRALDEWGGLDIMVNNAGIGIAATTPDTSEEDWARVIDVCLTGTFLGMKFAIPAIRDSGGGSITNISSVAAIVGVRDRAAYSAAKGGILALTRAAAMDHIEEGVRINCIAPGTVDTPWIARITAGYEDPDAAKTAMKARQPHGRLVSADEIAAMAAYLSSDEAGSVVGAAMVVDGGMTAR
jgi:NAD(P)-dependent dehydrogenase (short-subunit alcohol dehydrogenase family)